MLAAKLLTGVFIAFCDLSPEDFTVAYSLFIDLLSVSLTRPGIRGRHQGSEVQKTRGFSNYQIFAE